MKWYFIRRGHWRVSIYCVQLYYLIGSIINLLLIIIVTDPASINTPCSVILFDLLNCKLASSDYYYRSCGSSPNALGTNATQVFTDCFICPCKRFLSSGVSGRNNFPMSERDRHSKR